MSNFASNISNLKKKRYLRVFLNLQFVMENKYLIVIQ